VIKTLDAASKTLSWQEIGTMLKESDNPVARQVAGVHPAEAAVDLLLGDRKVLIHVHESVEVNVASNATMRRSRSSRRSGTGR